MTFKPLLASKAEPHKIKFPVMASPKIDGIRCIIHPDHGPVTRTLKPIPNHHIRESLPDLPIDGELVTFTNGKIDDFNTVQSKVMKREGVHEFKFMAFDELSDLAAPFQSRFAKLKSIAHPLVEAVPHTTLQSGVELTYFEQDCIKDGWEGVMLRQPLGLYKCGRSTVNEGILLKVKQFTDDEARIIGVEEQMTNNNLAKQNALGRTERSTAKAGLVQAGVLGAFVCDWRGQQFNVGTGFTADQRANYWQERDKLVGQLVTFKYQGVGSNGAPRFPTFLGLRHDLN